MSNYKPEVVAVILAGGGGSRLWPLSRESHPKQFIKLADNQSFIQKAILRSLYTTNAKEVVTITNRELFFYTKDEYEAINSNHFNTYILEPFGRNSAAAIALAGQYISNKYGRDTIMLVLPADHLIEKDAEFQTAVTQAIALAANGHLVTFGIQPTCAHTGYGYIKTEGHDVLQFVEKPNLTQAKEYFTSGAYLWNSGIFCMQSGILHQEMTQYCPEIEKTATLCLENAHILHSKNFQQIEIKSVDFQPMPSISIDYAVMEKSKQIAVVKCDIGWSDIGSWLDFGKMVEADEHNNHITGTTVLQDVQDCIVYSQHKLIAALGVHDLIIADAGDAVLVADVARAQEIRGIVEQLKLRNHDSYKLFPTTHRPWGTYTVLQEGPGFKIKRIEVKPYAALSLQSHVHRSEHFVVVSGSAKVVNGDEILHLERNQSTYVPAGNKHRLENPTTELLIIIEVQCGSYLGEDDIIRYEDIYGRMYV